jgi:hypothetical protein
MGDDGMESGDDEETRIRDDRHVGNASTLAMGNEGEWDILCKFAPPILESFTVDSFLHDMFSSPVHLQLSC